MTIRVLVVEDSLTVRRRIVEVLSADPEIVVVGEAADGDLGVALCERLRPDVATFDMVLPGKTGLEATEHIMAYFPTPIVIVSSSTNRGEMLSTYDALAAGAVDVLDKPDGSADDDGWDSRLVARVKLVSKIKVITHPRARIRDQTVGRVGTPPRAFAARSPLAERRLDDVPRPAAIGIGASTGGPGALLEILRALPSDLPVPVLVVLHVAPMFASALPDWLDRNTRVRVAEASAGERLKNLAPGTVLVAPPNKHLAVASGRVALTAAPERHFCRPSVDVLFESMALDLGASAVGCLLTGMGRDGAAGLLAMRRAGARTFAQDEATSVVYGMPREAALIGAAERVLPLERIADALVAAARGLERVS
ncbi:MAG TPA: chemotaxis-specific protein-glutamate methyltransferase CheB [Byssovorax sp.]|jgi:two-component system chemotaxis response regulator CheB